MSCKQAECTIHTQGRGTYNISQQLNQAIVDAGITIGLCHVFIKHTSASLLITENADPDVRTDLETLIQRLAPDADPHYRHTLEGPDDMSAHGRCMLTQTELTLPISAGRLNLGTWQGIYLWEHRTRGFKRSIALTFIY